MKKSLILTLGLFFGMIGMMSCNGGKDAEREKAVKDSLYQDSVMKAQAASADSARIADSTAQAAAAQALADSLRQDSIAKAGKGKKK
jgi:hypothetical protein